MSVGMLQISPLSLLRAEFKVLWTRNDVSSEHYLKTCVLKSHSILSDGMLNDSSPHEIMIHCPYCFPWLFPLSCTVIFFSFFAGGGVLPPCLSLHSSPSITDSHPLRGFDLFTFDTSFDDHRGANPIVLPPVNNQMNIICIYTICCPSFMDHKPELLMVQYLTTTVLHILTPSFPVVSVTSVSLILVILS